MTLAFDEASLDGLAKLHARGAAFTLRRLPVPGGENVDLELRPVAAMEPGAKAQVVEADGSVSWLAPSVLCFAGQIDGGGPAFLGLRRGELDGYLVLDGELYFLSSAKSAPGRATLAHASQVGEADTGPCGVIGGSAFPGGGIERLAAVPTLRTADIFIEADDHYRARFVSDQECIDYTELLLTAASEIYRRDIGVRLNIPNGYLRVWKTTPPWGVITGFPGLKNVYNYWLSTQNPLRNLPRAAVHVLTNPIFGGTSRGVDGLCDNIRAYEISSVSGRFPYPIEHTSRYNWDLFVVCHELGHTFGSPHSDTYSPPIQCQDGSGPDSGTLMSYCHLDFGIVNVGMRFHLREQLRIRGAIGDARCLRSLTLVPGDYDGDGDLGPTDYSAARGIRSQGFRSLGAEEVLDMDRDGDFDDLDLELLAEQVYGAPPASVRARNGSGVNPMALQALGNPVLGTTWRTKILAPGVGTSTLLVGYDLPHAGIPTARGELLVSTAPYGGTKLFSDTTLSDGVSALHELVLPYDLSLFGRAVSFQGLALGTQDEFYTNALDVVLSPYE